MDIDLWYQRYGESVHRRCLRLCRNEQQAMDLVQEVFLRAHRYRQTFRGEASPLTWLFTLADRCFFDTLGEPVRVQDVGIDEVASEDLEGFEESFVSQDSDNNGRRHDVANSVLSECGCILWQCP